MSGMIEKIMGDAKMLVSRLKDHDNLADSLIGQSESLHLRMEAMKTYQEDLSELNEMARHRPRANLVLGLLQENNQIRELQQENRELRLSLEEHQSAIELIMTKYREQVVKLMSVNKMHNSVVINPDMSDDIQDKITKICEMAAVMQRAVRIDEENAAHGDEVMTRLQLENGTLRELLRISTNSISFHPDTAEIETQTAPDPGSDSEHEHENSVLETTVIHRPPAAQSGVDDDGDDKDTGREKDVGKGDDDKKNNTDENDEDRTNGNTSQDSAEGFENDTFGVDSSTIKRRPGMDNGQTSASKDVNDNSSSGAKDKSLVKADNTAETSQPS